MQVQVLGYWGTYPGPGEATTGFLVHANGRKILLDCGSGVLAQLFQVCPVTELDAVVITHHHHDHVADLGVLSYALLLSRLTKERSRSLPIYLPQSDSDAVSDLVKEPLAEVHTIDATTQIDIDGVSISFAQTTHPVYCLAPRFESGGKVFVFSADSSWNESLIRHAGSADLFICEASMYDGMEENAQMAGHLTSTQAGMVAAQAHVKRMAITHYPHYGSIETLAAEAASSFGQPVEQLQTLQILSV